MGDGSEAEAHVPTMSPVVLNPAFAEGHWRVTPVSFKDAFPLTRFHLDDIFASDLPLSHSS